jgi:Skp family chaperone for outer membrane proteins
MNKAKLNALKSSVYKGAFLTKEAPADLKAAEALLKPLTEEMGNIVTGLEKSKKDAEERYRELTANYGTVKTITDDLKATLLEHATKYAEHTTKAQMFEQALDQVKKELNAPLIKGGSDLAESDRKAAVELQRRAFMFKGGLDTDFKPDLNNLVDATHYRAAVRKLMQVGIESKEKIVRSLPELERKAYEASSLDSALFSPEMLGIEINCIVECAELLDLYNMVSVSKSQFMYPQVMSYADIGKYDCDAKCDAEYGPDGNITYKSGSVSDFCGVFCFQRKVLAEANYDLLNFMYNAAARSHRVNRNRALMVGDGLNEPRGWLTANCFPKRKTKGTSFDHIEFRTLHGTVPVEYGPVTTVMHQNVFAYLAAMVDNTGRFLFGDGMMTYSPDDVRDRIRISNCLPDPTHGMTKGATGAPFVTGEFILAVGAWKAAYYAVSKRPLWIEQWEGKSTAWCVAYSFGAEDGGFVGCCPAATILTVGP